MRRVTLGRTGIETSCLGFGCASLGSRVPAANGLRALAAAFEQGVTWLDLAPAYGRGAAETIAAEFIRGRRGRLGICTKVGLAPPNAGGGLAAALAPLARRAVTLVPGLRGAVRRSGATRNAKLPLTAELVTASLETSLRRLGTDHVDLYALHNAEPAEIAREELLRALEEILASGKARALAVAGSPEVAAAAITRGAPFSAVQIALPAPGTGGPVLPAARAAGFGSLTHSVFGVEGSLAALGRRVAGDAAARAEVLAATGLANPQSALARALLGRAFALNPSGVVLVSMFSPTSRAANLALADTPPGDPSLAAAAALIDRLAAGGVIRLPPD